MALALYLLFHLNHLSSILWDDEEAHVDALEVEEDRLFDRGELGSGDTEAEALIYLAVDTRDDCGGLNGFRHIS